MNDHWRKDKDGVMECCLNGRIFKSTGNDPEHLSGYGRAAQHLELECGFTRQEAVDYLRSLPREYT
jgi:hypothetical protein